MDFAAYVSGPRFGNHNDFRFELSLVPVPYAGDLSRSDIFLLQLNPGFNLVDYYGESRMAGFRARLRRNLYQELDGVEFPFPFLGSRLN